MKLSTIFIWHLGAVMLYVALLFLSEFIWPEVAGHRIFSLYAGGTFVLLSFIISIFSSRLVDHKNPYYFSWVTMLSVLIKLGIGVGIVVIYSRVGNPLDKLYIVPFLLSYIIFTVCEVYILQRIIQSVKKPWSN